MFKRLLTRIRTADAAPPWGLPSAIGAALAAFAAVIVGTTITALVAPTAQYNLLLGWCIAALLTIIFVFVSRPRPEQRDALWHALQATAAANPGGKRARAELPTSVGPVARPQPNALFLLFIGVGVGVGIDVLGRALAGAALPTSALQSVYFNTVLEGAAVSAVSWLFGLLLLGLLQPLAEALVFQGVLLPALRAQVGPWPGFLLTVVSFAAFHFLAYPPSVQGWPGTWYGLFTPLLVGLFVTGVRVYTGSTRSALLVQAAVGLFALANLLSLVG